MCWGDASSMMVSRSGIFNGNLCGWIWIDDDKDRVIDKNLSLPHTAPEPPAQD